MNSRIARVSGIGYTSLEFDNGDLLYSDHFINCCERHFLCFEHLSKEDFEGLEFDLSGDAFFERVPGFGIRLVPLNGHPVAIPGYGENNGYYSDDLTLYLQLTDGSKRVYDITECQDQGEA